MDGILLFNKPILWTSHDAVDFVRRRIGQRAVGHAGTLDPMATGLLLLLLGKATKSCMALSGLGKEYTGGMRLGITTDTQDLDGRILSESDADGIGEAAVRKVFASLEGDQEQIPPAYSAIKQEGKKLYELARRGTMVQAKPRPISVKELHLLRFSPPEAYFVLSCSKGTYVRALCDEAGKRLGCGAALSSLVRTRVGEYSLEKALTEEQLKTYSLKQIHENLLRV